MNKKLMALAVAGAIAAPTVAMAQNVQIGGSLTVLYYLHDPKNLNGANASGKKGDIMEGSEPEMYIRGEEKLGGGLSAWFQCTSSFDLWGGAGAEGFCSRNSALGFKGGFGNVFFGNWDTPHKLNYNQARGAFSGTNALYGGSATLLYSSSASGVGNAVQSTSFIINSVGVVAATTTAGSGAASFYRRQARSVSWHSPSWGGIDVKGMFSSGTEHTGLALSPLNPRLFSFSGAYTGGPFYFGLGYELHQDYNAGNVAPGSLPTQYNGGDDTNISLVGVWTIANAFRLSGVYSKTEYEVSNSTTTEVEGFGVYLDWKISGPHSLRFQYSQVDDPSGNSTGNVGNYIGGANALEGGATVIGAHYEYAFSKRTAMLFSWNQMENDSGTSRFSQGKSAASLGGKQTSIGMAIKHRF